MENLGKFPFGEEVKRLTQKDRSPKKYFVIGSYASAVHSSWYDKSGKLISRALAVANEPDILWAGNSFEAMSIINRVNCPPDAGRLSDPGKRINGGVGRLFYVEILKPLNILRSDVWFTLLIPFTVANKGQRKSLNRYKRVCGQFNLPESSILPSNIKSSLITEQRIKEILNELEESKAEVIITLGDLPIYHFIRLFDSSKVNLSLFSKYGVINTIEINNKIYKLLPVYHPKSGENIGSYTERLRQIHNDWKKFDAPEIQL
ncbi:MAG TPA: hypothetical protein VK870_04285 [Ignavibacteriaceae bacterium]|nr:hypothetical protein [Ignavibacteriaceae bacterium]